MKRLLKYLLCLLAVNTATAQHFQFSQFYAAPTYINPAFTGANVCSRFSLNYRSQWTGVGGFETYQVSYDTGIPQAKSGIGFQAFSDNTGAGGIKTRRYSGLYAYEARLSKFVVGRAGFSAGMVQRSIDYTGFTFADQIARGNSSVSTESLVGASVKYLDLSSGILLYGKNFWGGFSAVHINRPNQSLLNGFSPLPPEFLLHGGYRFEVGDHTTIDQKNDNNNTLMIAGNYKKQGKFNQMDVGVYYTKHQLVLGFWYRGLPFFRPTPTYRNSDALVFLFGVSYDRYKFGYSYDYTVSKLTNGISKGTSEVSMAFQLCTASKNKFRKKKYPLIVCPKF